MTQKDQTSQKTFVEVNLERYTMNPPLNLKNFWVTFLPVGNCGLNTMNLLKNLKPYPAIMLEKFWVKKPQFAVLLEVLESKMQQYRSNRAALSEFRAVKQTENESLKYFFRRVRYLGSLALSEKSLTERDHDLCDQFLDALLDLRLQQKLYEDETDLKFCEVLQGPRTRAHPEKFWTKKQTTAVAFPCCENYRSRITETSGGKELSSWPWEWKCFNNSKFL